MTSGRPVGITVLTVPPTASAACPLAKYRHRQADSRTHPTVAVSTADVPSVTGLPKRSDYDLSELPARLPSLLRRVLPRSLVSYFSLSKSTTSDQIVYQTLVRTRMRQLTRAFVHRIRGPAPT